MDSVGLWFPKRKLIITNFLVSPMMFNIFTLRGGRYRDPMLIIEDARWFESRNAEVLIDVHHPAIVGQDAVRHAIERSVDQIRQVRDQTVRLIAAGLDARQAAENIVMSPSLRAGAEVYGQIESHVRAVWGAERGWFGNDVYDINPLSEREEAARLVAAMGGAQAVRDAAQQAVDAGGLDGWRWGLKLTSLLLTLDPTDEAARAARAVAARALGQRTTAANARGFYITEALQMENRLLAQGQPVTIDLLRRLLGTPKKQQLMAVSPRVVLDYLCSMVDPVKAGEKRVEFTLAIEGDPVIHRIVLRNGVLIVEPVQAAGAIHVAATREQLADFFLGNAPLPSDAAPLKDFGDVFDRSQFLTLEALAAMQGQCVRDCT